MSLIQQLQNFNLDLTKLHELSEQDIIRIEKKFKAEIKLNDNLDMNDLEQVIHVLKNQQQDMIWLMSEELKLLKSILSNPQKFIVKKGAINIDAAIDRIEFSLFLETYFAKELRQYVDKCIKNDFYNALHSLLKFQAVLSPQLLNEIQQKLTNKLTYAIECITIAASDISRKISYCTNPFFYRVLSQLGSGQFESDVTDLLNTTIGNLKTQDVHWALVFAMGSFAAQGESLKATLRSNKSIASQRGFGETKVNRYTGRATGGVSNSGEPLKKGEKKKDKQWGIYLIYFVIALIIVSVFGISKCQRRNQINDNLTEFGWNPGDDSESYSNEVEAAPPSDLSIEANSFEGIINYLHSDEVEITAEREIPFDIDATQLNKDAVYKTRIRNVRLVNLLGERVVVQSRTLSWNRYHVLEPNGTAVISNMVMGLKFYVGKEPILVDYIDPNGASKTHFMFKQITDLQLDDFNNFHNVDYDFADIPRYEIRLMYKNDEVVIDIYRD